MSEGDARYFSDESPARVRMRLLRALLGCALLLVFFGLAMPSDASAQTGWFVSKWGTMGSGDGEMNTPCAVVVGHMRIGPAPKPKH